MSSARRPSSKQFLIDRILDQANEDGVVLDDVEIRMLDFTEVTASQKSLETAQRFEHEYDEGIYETKIAALIRRAYDRDKNSDNRKRWDDALIHVAGRDLYLNVMIDRSGIDKSGLFGSFGDWRFVVHAVLPAAFCLAAALVIGFAPIGATVVHSDFLRLLVVVILIAMPFAIYRIRFRKPSPRMD